MSSLVMTQSEQNGIDSNVEQMLDWASGRRHEAEQLAMDAARLLSCTGDRLDRLKKQGFFKRCWSRFNGDAAAAERANTSDLIQMQKTSLRYINMLQEQQLMMAHSMLTLKNNLLSLAIKEEETRHLVGMLAQRTLERFEKLEHRVGQLEVSTKLQGWLLSLEEQDYDEKFPTEYMRLFRVINDFYSIKNDGWSYNDLMFMRKAIRTVGINPKRKLSLNAFIDSLTDEIQQEGVGFDSYGQAITLFAPQGVSSYSRFVVENISSPVFTSIHGLKTQYMDRLDIVEELQDEMNISTSEALKRLLRRSISNLNVDLNYEFPLAETAIEILGCMRLATLLALPENSAKEDSESATPESSSALEFKSALEEYLNPPSKQEDAPEQNTTSYVDVQNLTMSNWKTVANTSMFLGEQDSWRRYMKINVFKVASTWVFFSDKGVFATHDFSEIKRVCDLEYHGASQVCTAGGRTFIGLLNKWAWSQDGINWERFDLPEEYAGETIAYRNVFFNDGVWYFWGQYNVNYDSIEQKFIGTKTVTRSYNSAVIYSGRDFSSLRAYSFIQDFPMNEVDDICYNDDGFIAALRDKSDDQDYLARSNDSITWSRGCISEPLLGIRYFGGDLYGTCCSLYKVFPEEMQVQHIDTNLDESMRINELKIYPEHNVAFSCACIRNKIYLSNDLSFWQTIDTPQDGNTDSLCYDGKQLVFVTKDGEILMRELR